MIKLKVRFNYILTPLNILLSVNCLFVDGLIIDGLYLLNGIFITCEIALKISGIMKHFDTFPDFTLSPKLFKISYILIGDYSSPSFNCLRALLF